MSNSARERGVALITAMLITALATMVAANLAWDNAMDVRRTMVLLNRDQAIQVALGAESWIISILHQDLQDSETDHLGEIWATDERGAHRSENGGRSWEQVVRFAKMPFNLRGLALQVNA